MLSTHSPEAATASYPPVPAAALAASTPDTCDECVGSGGWFRYEPALEPAPGLLYLSCLHCRGSGRVFRVGA